MTTHPITHRPAPLDIRIEAASETANVVFIEGELDLAAADRLTTCLREAAEKAQTVIVDLCDCTFIDSTGVSVLIAAAASDGARAATVALAGPGGQVQRTLDLTGVGIRMPVFPTTAEALRALASG